MNILKKTLATATLIGAATFGSVVIGVAAAPSAQAGSIVCHTVTIPKTEPWYKCVKTSPTQRLLPGCYVQTKRVCD